MTGTDRFHGFPAVGKATAIPHAFFSFVLPGLQAPEDLLAFLWAWMALAYHLAYFADINPAAPLLAAVFLAQGAALLWNGAARGRLAP